LEAAKEAEDKKKSGVPDPAPDTEEEAATKEKTKKDAAEALGDAAPKDKEAAKKVGESVDSANITDRKKDGTPKPDGEEKKEETKEEIPTVKAEKKKPAAKKETVDVPTPESAF
jgi:hypothetical protein